MSDTPPASAPNPAPVPATTPAAPGGKIALAVAAALFLGWLGWLGVTALTKSRAPTVSRAQAAVATVPVRATLTTATKDAESMHLRPAVNGGQIVTVLRGVAEKPAFVVEVVEKIHPNGPEAGTKIGVGNLTACGGYTGPGEYLLLLTRDGDATIDGHPAYTLVGQQRSPGADYADVGPPLVYAWSDDIRAQAKRLFAARE